MKKIFIFLSLVLGIELLAIAQEESFIQKKSEVSQREAEESFKKVFPSWSMADIQLMVKDLWAWFKLKGTQLTMSSDELEAALEDIKMTLDNPAVKRKLARSPEDIWEALPAGVKLKMLQGEPVSVGEIRSAIAGERALAVIYEKGGAHAAEKVGEYLIEKYGTKGLEKQSIYDELGLPNVSQFGKQEMIDAFKGQGSLEARDAAKEFADTIRSNFEFKPE
jgi:hypothetical protein